MCQYELEQLGSKVDKRFRGVHVGHGYIHQLRWAGGWSVMGCPGRWDAGGIQGGGKNRPESAVHGGIMD
jgi:hypothetical protein